MSNSNVSKDVALNPFYGLGLGAYWDAKKSKFLGKVLNDELTVLISQQEGKVTMTGNSRFVHSDEMNQWSLGLSGSKGVTGVSKISGAIGICHGSSQATAKEKTTVNYNAFVWGGIQHVKFDDLSVAQFIAGMTENAQVLLNNALDHYLNTMEQLRAIAPSTLIDVLKDPQRDAFKSASHAVRLWLDAVTTFRKYFGESVVVAVLWGGVGTVRLEISSKGKSKKSKTGGKLSASFAGTGGAVAIEGVLGLEDSQNTQGIEYKSSGNYSGGCVADLVGKWLEIVDGKNWEAIAKVRMTEQAPSLHDAVDPPAIPDFEKKEGQDKLTNKLDKIKDLEGLQVFAQADAFERAKAAALDKWEKENKGKKKQDRTPKPNPNFEEFLNASTKDADITGLESTIQNVRDNKVDARQRANAVETEEFNARVASVGASKQDGSYVPLGLWVANWGDLFPWLVTGYANSITDTDLDDEGIVDVVQRQTMAQDFIALSRLLRLLDDFNLPEETIGKSCLGQLADDFAHNTEALEWKSAYEIISKMTGTEKLVYQKWNESPFFRNCELGVGILNEHSQSVSMSREWQKSEFKPAANNCTVFADCIKGYPVVMDNKKLCLITIGDEGKDRGKERVWTGHDFEIDSDDSRASISYRIDSATYNPKTGKYYFFRSDKYVAKAQGGTQKVSPPKSVSNFFNIPSTWKEADGSFKGIDAAVFNNNSRPRKYLFFFGDEYVTKEMGSTKKVTGPEKIAKIFDIPPKWKERDGSFKGIDAVAFNPKTKTYYFFRGDSYVGKKTGTRKVEGPKKISKFFKVPDSWEKSDRPFRIDAALFNPNTKPATYRFFMGDEYVNCEFRTGTTSKHRKISDGFVNWPVPWGSTLFLYPIPFDAAAGAAVWKGGSMCTNFSSSGTRMQKLNSVVDQLRGLSAYSFSSDTWEENGWNRGIYSMNTVKTRYVGLVEEPSLFG